MMSQGGNSGGLAPTGGSNPTGGTLSAGGTLSTGGVTGGVATGGSSIAGSLGTSAKVSGKPGNVSLSLAIDDMPLISVTDTDTSTPVADGYAALGSKKAISFEYDDIKVSTP